MTLDIKLAASITAILSIMLVVVLVIAYTRFGKKMEEHSMNA